MKPATISVRVQRPDADADDVHELAHDLREALLDTNVDDVRQDTLGAASAGAKSGETIAVGALVVSLAPTVVESLMKSSSPPPASRTP